MSIGATSNASHFPVSQNQTENPRMLAYAGEEGNHWSTVAKVAAVVGAFIATIASSIFIGPLAGIVIAGISGIGALLLFGSRCDEPHSHGNAPSVPWYQRYFPFFNMAPATPVPMGPNVPVGHGHMPPRVPAQPHVPVGHGHSPAPVTPWYERLFSWIPSGTPTVHHHGNPANTPVGHGHLHHQPGNQTHIPVGRGHTPPVNIPQPPPILVPPNGNPSPFYPDFILPGSPPPSSGHRGHIPPGSGHFHG